MPAKKIKKTEKVEEKKDDLKEYDKLKNELKQQLIKNNNYNKVTNELLEKYIKFTKMEDDLYADIDERGVSIEWNNGGGQRGYKKNDSLTEITKVNNQKMKILDKLGIKAPESKEDGDEDYEV